MNSDIPIQNIILVIIAICIILFLTFKIFSSTWSIFKKTLVTSIFPLSLVLYLLTPYINGIIHEKDIDAGVDYNISSGYEIVDSLKNDPAHYIGITALDSSGNVFVCFTDKNRYGESKTDRVNFNNVEIIKNDSKNMRVGIERGQKIFYKINSKNEKYVLKKEPIVRIFISSDKIVNNYVPTID